MTPEDVKAILLSPLGLFVVMLLASMANGIQQLLIIKKTGKPMPCLEYFSYFPETLAMLFGNLVAFLTLIAFDQLNFAAAISIGYGINSAVDLLPMSQRSTAMKATPDDPAKVSPPRS